MIRVLVDVTTHGLCDGLPPVPSLPSPSLMAATPQSDSGSVGAVESAVDVATLVGMVLAGAGIGFLGALVVSLLLRRFLASSSFVRSLAGQIRTPVYVALSVWGAWTGLQFAVLNHDLSAWKNGVFVAAAAHAVLIGAILALTWAGWAAARVVEDAARLRHKADSGRARRFETQAQVVRRLLQAGVVVVGVVTVLYTFEATRSVMTTVLASAGVISVVVGFAAQQTLGNVFAGVQLAFTDAIRVGDVLVVEKGESSGAVEEITLSYVVVRMGDDRRLMVPSRHFTLNTFENWTRRTTKQLGTIELQLDWAAPIGLIRHKVEEILQSTDLWDGRMWAVQMTNTETTNVVVRIQVSAQDSGRLWDLRCHLREELVRWIVQEEPWMRPNSGQANTVCVDAKHIETAPSSDTASKSSENRKTGENRVRGAQETGAAAATTSTPVETSHKGERLYSGSAEAEERSQIWEGPGEEALAEREEMIRRRDARHSHETRPEDPRPEKTSAGTHT